MLHKSIRLIACFCLAALLLTGCNTRHKINFGAMGSEVWEEMPALNVGTLSYDKLEVLPWNSGRCEATSRNSTAETENGYYENIYGFLFYAEKSDLSTWLPVCNQPECEHKLDSWSIGEIWCNAILLSDSLIIKDNRLLIQTNLDAFKHLSPYKNNLYFLLSMAPDATDKQFLYAIERGSDFSGGISANFLTDRGWLCYYQYLDKEGELVGCLYHTTDAGTQKYPLHPREDVNPNINFFSNGDEAFRCNALGTSEFGCFRFIDGELVETECAGLEAYAQNGYLSGNTLRIFRPNDGYYDVDLTTREEVFLAPAQLENSNASIKLPNCIIESTLFDSSGMTKQDTHRMMLFDGEAWREVALPQELVESGDMYSFVITSVNSDSIFLGAPAPDGSGLYYRIPLGTETLAAEYCGALAEPREEDTE